MIPLLAPAVGLAARTDTTRPPQGVERRIAEHPYGEAQHGWTRVEVIRTGRARVPVRLRESGPARTLHARDRVRVVGAVPVTRGARPCPR